jgi:putative hydrolase of the HAD superfamily
VVIRGVVFDVDDTLYVERDYVRSGFVAVGRAVGSSEGEAVRLTDWLWSAFEEGRRGDTFDRLRAAFPDVAARASTADLVAIYRSHSPDIRLAADVREVLDGLAGGGVRLGVLSDGPLESQAAKVAALGIAAWCDPIILTAAFDPSFRKPGSAGFAAIADEWQLPPTTLAYVADNPEKDFVGPNRIGWTSIRLRHDRQLRHHLEPVDATHRPAFVVARLPDLYVVLALPVSTGAADPGQ